MVTAVVIGGAGGIGAACAHRLAAGGVRVVTADLASGADHHVDVSDPHSVAALAEAVGPVGILVNCAGVIGPSGPPVDLDLGVEPRRHLVTAAERLGPSAGVFVVGDASGDGGTVHAALVTATAAARSILATART